LSGGLPLASTGFRRKAFGLGSPLEGLPKIGHSLFTATPPGRTRRAVPLSGFPSSREVPCRALERRAPFRREPGGLAPNGSGGSEKGPPGSEKRRAGKCWFARVRAGSPCSVPYLSAPCPAGLRPSFRARLQPSGPAPAVRSPVVPPPVPGPVQGPALGLNLRLPLISRFAPRPRQAVGLTPA
jgi:hypothetical protein